MTDDMVKGRSKFHVLLGGTVFLVGVIVALAVVGGVVRRLLLWGWGHS